MKRCALLCCIFVCSTLAVHALQREELSPAAQALVPDGGGLMTVVTHGGTEYEGILSMETDDRIMLKVKKPGGTIYSSVPIMKSDIKTKEPKDVAPLLFNKLVEFQLNDEIALPEDDYRRAIALFDEFIQKVPSYPEIGRIQALRRSFAAELDNLGKGLKKVGSEWTTPVCGTVKEFDLYSAQMKELEARPDFRSDAKIQEFHKSLVEKRREVVRSLPGMVKATVPNLIAAGNYETAVNEVISFMQFWCDQVVKAEGPAAEVMKQMDFGQIIRLEQAIMDSYIAAGKGKDGPAAAPKEKNMVYVPGGYFLMGREDAAVTASDFPMHIVYVAPYLIGKYEVSNREYREFIEYIKKTGDSSMEHPSAPLMKKHDPAGWNIPGLSRDDQPVVGVDWFDAYAYAKWRGMRLPTEAEWEKAARTMDSRKYPWGKDDPKEMTASYAPARSFMAAEMDRQNPPVAPQPQGGCSCVKKELPPPPPTRLPEQTWDVDKHLPEQAVEAIANEFLIWKKSYKFAYDALHMAGNAAEWVYDFYDPQYYRKSPVQNPKGPVDGKHHVYRGGSYLSTKPEELAGYVRYVPDQPGMNAGCMPDGKPFVGFRVVKDLGLSGSFHEDAKKDAASGKSFDQFMNELNADAEKDKE